MLRIYAANIGYKKRQGFAWTMSGPLSAGGAGTGTNSTTRDSNVMFEHCPSGPRMLLIVVVCAGPFPYRQLSPSPPGSLNCGLRFPPATGVPVQGHAHEPRDPPRIPGASDVRGKQGVLWSVHVSWCAPKEGGVPPTAGQARQSSWPPRHLVGPGA